MQAKTLHEHMFSVFSICTVCIKVTYVESCLSMTLLSITHVYGNVGVHGMFTGQ